MDENYHEAVQRLCIIHGLKESYHIEGVGFVCRICRDDYARTSGRNVLSKIEGGE